MKYIQVQYCRGLFNTSIYFHNISILIDSIEYLDFDLVNYVLNYILYSLKFHRSSLYRYYHKFGSYHHVSISEC